MNTDSKLAIALVAAIFAGSAHAAVSAEDAKQLGTVLTPWGAEKGGNKDGTIPAYTGDPIKMPASYDPKNPGLRPDPFADEKPLFSITAQNMDKYADKLSDGQKAMLKRYPNYRMDVYRTHRTARYPEYVDRNSIKNAIECKTTDGGKEMTGCYAGVPFPIPKTGDEVVWDHRVQYQTSVSLRGDVGYYVSLPSGLIPQAIGEGTYRFPFYDIERKTPTSNESNFQSLTFMSGPARKAGEGYLVVDQVNNQSRVWSYIPGQRRVKLAPDVNYDTPSPTSGGTANVDDAMVFYGAQDRWDFKLVGKKELFIMYNMNRSQDRTVCPIDKLATPNFMNPDCTRWELHRVWVVDATLKPGFRHNYSKRTFYFDEDIPGAGTADNYDAAGKLYRISDAFPYPLYDLQGTPGEGQFTTASITQDMTTGGYFLGPVVASKAGLKAIPYVDSKAFSPDALAGEGIR